MTNADVAKAFSALATMLEMDGANPFRVRAYREAARVVETQGEPVETLARAPGRLEEIAGIGKDLAQKIRDLVETGTTPLFDEMKAKYPLEVVALTELQGMGPKRVKTLFDRLQVRDRADLERAARAGLLRELPGFGETLEKNVLKALELARQHSGRMLLSVTWPVAHDIAGRIRRLPGVEVVEIAGSFRRRKETVGDLDLLVSGGDPEEVMTAFTGHGDVTQVLVHGETKSSVRLRNGLQVDLRRVPPESFGAALLYFTGSKEHNIELRKLALERGLNLNEYGLLRGERTVAGHTEDEVYRALDLAWIPPELREARGEIEQARDGRLPALIEERDLRGDLHLHTDRTDGRDTLEAMVRAARDRGYAYCAITDHSKAIAMAGGFDEARVRQSVDEVARVRRQVPGIEVLHGLEVDILADGALDLADDALALLDWVIVSLHSRLDQPPAAMTERVLRAISHPAVHVMGHPTARLIGAREPAAFDVERVLTRAAEVGVAMEINAQPHRVDLNDVHARRARELGVDLVISTDAHGVGQLDHVRYGVFAARRAGLLARDVLNTLPYERIQDALQRRGVRARASTPDAAPKSRRAAGSGSGAAKPGRSAVEPGRAPKRGAAPARKPAAGDPGTVRRGSSAAKRPKAARRPAGKKSERRAR